MIYIIRFFKWLWEKLSNLWTVEDIFKAAETYKEEHPDLNKKIEDVIHQIEVGPDPISLENENKEVTAAIFAEEQVTKHEEIVTSEILPAVTIEELTIPEPLFSFSSPVSSGVIGASYTQVTRMRQSVRIGSSWIG